MEFKPLDINGLVAKLPIVQGGMGIGISLSGLAGAVASCGGVGIISAAQPGFSRNDFFTNNLKANLESLAQQIKKAKEIAKGGVIGVNLMCAMNNYEQFVKCSVENKVDLIISGAGLPINLPELVKNSATKIAPIVSSFKAAKVLLSRWEKKSGVTADMVVVEGPKAGGHLGFTKEAAESDESFDSELKKILDYVKEVSQRFGRKIPVVFAGGVSNKEDINHYINLGCDGVQIATRFIATVECDAHENYKQMFINAKQDDIVIVQSPVGMPGRAIRTNFTEMTKLDKVPVKRCTNCLSHCDPKTTPYCITEALINGANGDTHNGLIFSGANGHLIDKIVTVKELMDELTT